MKMALVPMPTVWLAAAIILMAIAFGERPVDAQGEGGDKASKAAEKKKDRPKPSDPEYQPNQQEGEASAPPPVRPGRIFGPPVEIEGVGLVGSGEFIITYIDEEAFKADDGAVKEGEEGGREVTELRRQPVRLVDFEALKGEDKAEEMEAKKAELEERPDVERVDYSVLSLPVSSSSKAKKKLPESGGAEGIPLFLATLSAAGALVVVVVVVLLVRMSAR